MTQLMQASHQWMMRPDDERFVSLDDMQTHFDRIRHESRSVVVASKSIHAFPAADNKGLVIKGRGDVDYSPTHWAFGQLASRAEAPAGYLRTLASPLAADCINYGLQFKRAIEDVGLLLQVGDSPTCRAATGPRYGRIWNTDIVRELRRRFGNGRDGTWKVPGEFGKAVDIDKRNTTLYASDRDMFVFLADEQNRIEVPNRRNGQPGTLARGFFIWNSEVGDKTFGLGTFLFDFVCMNRIVWGAAEYKEVKIRHSASAPVRFLEEMAPAINSLATSSTHNIVKAIADARAARIDVDVAEFMAKRFGANLAVPMQMIHVQEEGRPIESLWDAATAATAYARGLSNNDKRVEIEREAGKVLKLAA